MENTPTLCRNKLHVLEEVGKTNDGRCRACTKEAARRTYLKHHESRLERIRIAEAARRERLRAEAAERPPKETCRSGKHLLATAGKTTTGSCLECAREAKRRDYERHKQERKPKMRVAYLEEHAPERLARVRAHDRARASYHKERVRTLRRGYGMTLDEYNAILVAQGGVCAICRQPETVIYRGNVKPLAVDHHHVTNVRRGLLCAKCNQALGLLQDDPQLLIAAAEYLFRFQQE